MPASAATIQRVDASLTGPGSQDGTSWATAFRSLHAALNATAAGDEIWVAKGTYVPGVSSTDTFELREGGNPTRHNSNILIFGGFLGVNHPTLPDGETLRGQRDTVRNVTILSGDIVGTTNDVQTVLTILVSIAEVDGFTITGGVGTAGAGIHIGFGSSPTIANCRIMGNHGHLLNGYGAGLYVSGNSSASIQSCVFEDNRCGFGAAIYLESGSNYTSVPTIERCVFIRNVAGRAGGAVANGYSSGTPIVNACTFIENQALGFSGDSNAGGGAIINLRSLEVANCLFLDNLALDNGGALKTDADSSFAFRLINSTLVGNRSIVRFGGGLATHYQQSLSIHNNVFWSNEDSEGTGQSAQIRYTTGVPTVTHCDIQGLDPLGPFAGNGNIDADPLFASAGSANLRPLPGSPCLNNGDSNVVTTATDLDGRTRIADGTVDMGAYELQPGDDCNSNETHDLIDLATAVSPDCNGNGVPDECDIDQTDPDGNGEVSPDCNYNGSPDECDLAIGTSYDCQPNGIPDDCEVFWPDCNHNCILDLLDISFSTSADCNTNGTPDECEVSAFGRWTTRDDFLSGTLINLDDLDSTGPIGGEGVYLQRKQAEDTAPLPFIWVAASRTGSSEPPGTVVRISTDTGEIVGEYRTGPQLHLEGFPSAVSTNPSRTSVDLDGSVWAGNRNEGGATQPGSVVKIGLVVGGARVNAVGHPDAAGQYLRPPFDYCTCEDRDGDGLIRTSRGLGDILGWTNVDGTDDDGGVGNAEDECILRYVRTAGGSIRHVSVDRDNNVWVGGNLDGRFDLLDGFTGDSIDDFDVGFGGYGGLIDYQGVLWSAHRSGTPTLLRYDTNNDTSSTITSPNSYGLGIDLFGYIWNSQWQSDQIIKFDPADQDDPETFSTGGGSSDRGVAVTLQDNHIWVANSEGDSVSRLDNNGNLCEVIAVGDEPTGVAVDANGRVWVTNLNSGTVSRIVPGADPPSPCGVGTGPSSVDMTISLGQSSKPYNYSDMTGMVALQTSATGAWNVVHDSGGTGGTIWNRVIWNTEQCVTTPVPPGTSLEVDVRASDNPAALAILPYTRVNDPMQELTGVEGRYIEVRVRFHGSCPESTFATPVLCDLAVIQACCKGDTNRNGVIDGLDIQGVVDHLLGDCLIGYCEADVNDDAAVTLADVPPFINLLLTGGNCASLRYEPTDCNHNGVADDNDLFLGNSPDCNANGVPDECEIDENSTAPGGPWYCESDCAADVNSNGIPDECEDDCNTNGIPDAWDISQSTSNEVNTNGVPDECEPDCNTNGVPDAWDISQSTSADCNTNGIPDECEPDCNTNGVPDDCDIDPTDPDGDQWVSPDCNGDGYPDECNLSLPPPFGSSDCNTNGIPDECDIADCESDPACNDCNANGIPDACDIAAEISADVNTNGIPDECEGESLMGGGGGESMMSSSQSSESEWSEEAAWEAFYDWAIAQCWGPNCETGMDEQFQAMIAKLQELGLPAQMP